MDFTIYTLGDPTSMQAALTAVSMIFSPSNTEGWVSNASTLGLGYMAALALMLGLVVALFRGVMTLKFELGQLIVGVIMYAIMFVPTMSVNIEDYYTGTLTRVDNVPLGIALPGAIISDVTHEVTSQMEVAFSTVDANHVSATLDGYLTPLKLLNQLRYGSKTMVELDPYLATSFESLLIDCVVGRGQFDANRIKGKPGSTSYIFSVLTSGSVSGLTVYYNTANPTGINQTCQAAAAAVQADFNTLYAGTDVPASALNPTGLSKFGRMISERVSGKNPTTGGGFTASDYEAAFKALTQTSGDEAKNFAIDSLAAGLITMAPSCANNSSSAAELARCMPLVQAMSQYDEDAAAGGSLFKRVMLHSMSVMLFLFYCFAPIIALIILAMGQQGMKVLGAYMLFGVWTQMWLPVATIINFFMQQKVSSEFLKLGSDPTNMPFGIVDMPAVYDMLATNIALASDLMAATPILTLALLTGSFFALTGVASRLSGKDYYDEKTNSPTLVANAPIAQNASVWAGTMGRENFAQGLSVGPTFSHASGSTVLHAQSAAMQTSYAHEMGLSENQTYSELFQQSTGMQQAWQTGKRYGLDRADAFQAALVKQYGAEAQAAIDASAERGSTLRDRASSTTGDTFSVKAGGGIGGKAGPLSGEIGGSFDHRVQSETGTANEISTGARASAGTRQGTTGGLTTSGNMNTAATMSKAEEYAATKRLATDLSHNMTDTRARSLLDGFKRADQYQEQAQRLESSANQMGVTGTYTAPEIVNAMKQNGVVAEAIDREFLDARLAMSPEQRAEFDDEARRQYAAQGNTQLADTDMASRERIARLSALEKFDTGRFGLALSTLTGDRDSFRGFAADASAIDARIQDGGANLVSTVSEQVAPVADVLPPGAAVAGVEGRVHQAEGAYAPLRDEAGQEARIAADKTRADHEVSAAGTGYIGQVRAHQGDPSYAEQQIAMRRAVNFMSAHAGMTVAAQAELIEAFDGVSKYAQLRGGTEAGRSEISTPQDQQRRTETGQRFVSALDNAIRTSNMAGMLPAQREELARLAGSAQAAANYYQSKDERLVRGLDAPGSRPAVPVNADSAHLGVVDVRPQGIPHKDADPRAEGHLSSYTDPFKPK